MKRFVYAISGVVVVLSVRAVKRLRALQEDISDRWEEVDTKQLTKQLNRFSKRAGQADPSALHKQVRTLAAAAESLRDRKLKNQVKDLQKSVGRLDSKSLKKQAKERSAAVRSAKVVRSRRRFPIAPLVIAAGAIGIGVLASRRRQQIAGQLGGLQDGAGRKLPGVLETIKSRSSSQAQANEQQLQAGVESAIHSAAPAIAPDLKVE